LSAERQAKRQQHWQGILTSACEQCGRNRVPQLEALTSLEAWLSLPRQGLVLAPTATQRFADLAKPTGEVQLLIGAEGGLSERELAFALEAGYQGIVLGKRILRTETAAVATLAICQAFWGDLA
jgi:16S rRNA (uracil1498-N3)-methyltransferase